MMHQRQASGVAVSAILFALVGLHVCGGCAAVRPPTLTPIDAVLIEQTDDHYTVELVFRVNNPNDSEIRLQETRYTAQRDGGPAFSGRRSTRQVLSAHGTHEIVLPAVFPGQAKDHIGRLNVSGRVLYLETGQLVQSLYDSGFRRPAARFSVSAQMSHEDRH